MSVNYLYYTSIVEFLYMKGRIKIILAAIYMRLYIGLSRGKTIAILIGINFL